MNRLSFHGDQSRANGDGMSWHDLSQSGAQLELRLISVLHREPKDAPASLLRAVDSEAMALAVSMQAAGAKQAYVAALIGKSAGYVSRMASGDRAIPDKLIGPLCVVTGSNLLRQFRAQQEALAEIAGDESARIHRLAEQLRRTA